MSRITSESEHSIFEKAVVEISNNAVENMAKAMVKKKKQASGKMVRSLRYKIASRVGFTQIDIFAVYYAKWVDVGRRKGAKRVPLKALLKWVRTRGITPDNGGSEKSLAFAIQTNIFKEGIKPANFIDEAQSKAKYTEEVTRALKIEVERGFENIKGF